MPRIRIAAAAAVLAVLGGLAAPASARADAAPSATVTASSPAHDEMASYTLSVAGFQPGSDSVTLAVTVGGAPYTLGYDESRNIGTDGTGSWTWPWTSGDPYGTYTFTFTDHAQHTASATIDIRHSPTAPVPAAGTGLMLDTASAPALTTIDKWKSGGAPYSAIGVYIATDAADPTVPTVDNRHDKQQLNLNSDWVSAVQGGSRPWHVVPIYVGLQAPCQSPGFIRMADDRGMAQQEGVDAARNAVEQSMKLGIARTSPVMADIESYDPDPVCSAATQAYLRGWTGELHRLGWLAGVYGGPTSVAEDIAAAKTSDAGYVLPDVVWAATDNRRPSTSVSNLPIEPWHVANQFVLGINRTYGNTTLQVDETSFDWSIWDRTAPVLTMGGAPQLVRTAAATFTWSAIDAESGVARYEVRTRRTATGRPVGSWSRPVTVPAAQPRTTASLAPGEQICAQVRAIDAAGNASGWSSAPCTSRVADDRTAHAGPGWRRAHRRSAYAGTLTVANRKRAVLALGRATARGSLVVVHAGRGSVTVAVRGRKVGVLRGSGTTWLTLPRAGAVTLTTTSSRSVTIDGFALIPR